MWKKANPSLTALMHARKIAPNSSFLLECENFYKRRRYLTKKQREVLMNIKPANPTYAWDGEDIDCYEEERDLCWYDPF